MFNRVHMIIHFTPNLQQKKSVKHDRLKKTLIHNFFSFSCVRQCISQRHQRVPILPHLHQAL
jgi:hypothetical protein